MDQNYRLLHNVQGYFQSLEFFFHLIESSSEHLVLLPKAQESLEGLKRSWDEIESKMFSSTRTLAKPTIEE